MREERTPRHDIWMVVCLLLFALGSFACQRPERQSSTDIGKKARATVAEQQREEAGAEDENERREETESEEKAMTFNFDREGPGALPPGWSGHRTGQGPLPEWKVLADPTAPSPPHVLAQVSTKGAGYYFALAVADHTHYKDVEIEVKFKAVEGREDRGGGPVWRYRDANNYYIARANPLENNFRVYKVVDGRRRMLRSASLRITSGQWHTIKVEHKGTHITCFYDGKKYLEVDDDTFQTAGKVGLWTKADAVTYFDDFTCRDIL